METTLAQLPVGQAGTIISLAEAGLARRRWLDLGLVPGTRVEAIRCSPAGDPVMYRVRGTLLALRQEHAGRIQIKIG
ncbi:MAG: FeoA family protein [Bacillota bacterium]